MANDNYRFYVEAGTDNAVRKLQELDNIMDSINKKADKGTTNFYNTSAKDVDKTVASMQKALELRKELNKEFEKNISSSSQKGDWEGLSTALGTMKQMNREYEKASQSASKLYRMNSTQGQANSNIVKDQKAYRVEVDSTYKALQRTKEELRDITNMTSRYQRAVNNATSTGRISYNQSQRLQADSKSQGRAEDFLGTTQRRRLEAWNTMDRAREGIRSVREEASRAKPRPDSKEFTNYKNREAALKEEYAQAQKAATAYGEIEDKLKGLAQSAEVASKKLEGVDVSVEAQRGTLRGTMQSRAPSIAMAGIGAAAYPWVSAYQRGATANAAMRPQVISIGQRTGRGDYRAIREEAQRRGTDRSLGYKGGDMLQFQEDVLGNMGYKGQASLTRTSQALAKGSRAVPVDSDTLSDFMNQNMRNGSVSGSAQVKQIQEGFVGAIKRSGMQGREEEQLKALQGLSEQTFAGRNGSSQELKSLMAMQSVLSGSGSRALQGEQGGQLMSSLNEGIKNSVNNPQARLMMGMGTKYKGTSGFFDFSKQMEKGISDPDNLRAIMRNARAFGGDNDKSRMTALMRESSQVFQTNMTTDQAEALEKLEQSGKLTQKNIEKVMNQNGKTGKDQFDKNSSQYRNSQEAKRNEKEAKDEKNATGINENKLTDAMVSVQNAVGGLPPFMATMVSSVAHWGSAIVTSISMSFSSEKINKILDSKLNTANPSSEPKTTPSETPKGNPTTGGPSPSPGDLTAPKPVSAPEGMFSKMKSAYDWNKVNGGTWGGIKGAAKEGWNVAGQGLTNVIESTKGAFTAGKDSGGIWAGIKNAAKNGGGFLKGKLPKGNGSFTSMNGAETAKDFMGGIKNSPLKKLFLGMGVYDTITSDDKLDTGLGNLGMYTGAFTKGGGLLGQALLGQAGAFGSDSIKGLWNGGKNLFGKGKTNSQMSREHQEKVKNSSWFGPRVIEKAFNGIWDNTIGAIAPGTKSDKLADNQEKVEKRLKKDKKGKKDKSFFSSVHDFFVPEVSADEIDPSAGSRETKGKKTASKNENRAKGKEDKDNTNKKKENEKTRENNNSKEKAHLSLYSKLLDRAQKILAQARAQNGIFGNGNGNGSGDGDEDEDKKGSKDDFGSGGKKNGSWTDAIKKAAKAMGVKVNDEDIAKINSLIQHESNGQESAQNNWDSNAQKGTPSKGILQYIDPTFDKYKVKGHGDIKNGYDQLLAFFNNKNWKTDAKLGGWSPTGGTRYARGGHVTSRTNAVIGEVPGQDEYVINPHQNTAPGLLARAAQQTAKKFDISNVFGNQSTPMVVVGGGASGSNSQQAPQLNNTNSISVNVTVEGNTSQEIADNAGNAIASKIDKLASDSMNFFSKEWNRR